MTAELCKEVTTSSAATKWPANTSTPGQPSQNPQFYGVVSDSMAEPLQQIGNAALKSGFFGLADHWMSSGK